MRKKLITIIITAFLASSLVSCATTTTPDVVHKPARKAGKPNMKEASELNTRLAVGYIQRQQYKAAKEKLEKAIDQNPDNLVAYKTIAYLYALLGLEEEADENYKEALRLNDEDPDLLNNYGAFLCSIDKLDEAQESFKLAYNDPFYESLYLAQSNAGSCYIKQQEYKKAEALLRKSLRVEPGLAGSLISMAEVGVKTERYLMARAYIQRYHAVRPATSESLWIQVQAEKALGAKNHYIKYARQLINEFPDSDEAGWVEAQAGNEQFRQ